MKRFCTIGFLVTACLTFACPESGDAEGYLVQHVTCPVVTLSDPEMQRVNTVPIPQQTPPAPAESAEVASGELPLQDEFIADDSSTSNDKAETDGSEGSMAADDLAAGVAVTEADNETAGMMESSE